MVSGQYPIGISNWPLTTGPWPLLLRSHKLSPEPDFVIFAGDPDFNVPVVEIFSFGQRISQVVLRTNIGGDLPSQFRFVAESKTCTCGPIQNTCDGHAIAAQ